MDESPVSFSAALPLWLKIVLGSVLAAVAVLAVHTTIRRRPGGSIWTSVRSYSRGQVVVPGLIAGGFLLLFAAVALDVAADGWITRTFDESVHVWFVERRDPGLTPAVIVVTNLVSPFGTTVLAIVAGTVLAWRTRSWIPPLLVFVGPSVAGLAVRLAKFVAPRSRPPELEQAVLTIEPSFPSGHVTGAVALYGCITMVVLSSLVGAVPLPARVGTVALATVAALIVLWTRLYLAVHWFTDVIAGSLLGLAVVFATLATFRAMARRRPVVG